MDKAGLLKRLDQAWVAFRASYLGLTEAQLSEPGVAGDWSVRDIIVHVTTWEQEAIKHLPLIMNGRRPPRYSVTYGGIHAFNRFMTEQKQGLTVAEVLQQQEETHGRLVDFIQATPEELFVSETRFRHRLRMDTYSHYPKHTEAIRKWRELRWVMAG